MSAATSRGARLRKLCALGLLLLVAAAPARLVAQISTGRPLGAAPGPRVPVLLVPGWADEADQLAPLRARFLGSNWSPEEVMTISFEDPAGSNIDHAREIADSLAVLTARTGSARVDIVAHSMGGLASRYLMASDSSAPVRRVVFIASPHRGTLLSLAAWGEGGREMRPGSGFLLRLDELRGVPARVEALTIRSRTDLHIIPNESATLPGVPDVEVCCPTHSGLLDDDLTFDHILRFLLRNP